MRRSQNDTACEVCCLFVSVLGLQPTHGSVVKHDEFQKMYAAGHDADAIFEVLRDSPNLEWIDE